MTAISPCDPEELRSAVPVREAHRRAARPGCASRGASRSSEPGPVFAEGDPAHLPLRADRGHRGHDAGGSATTTSRSAGPASGASTAGAFMAYLGRPGPAGLPELAAGDRAVPVLRARRGLLRPDHERVVPDAGAPARGPVLRQPADQGGGRPAGAAARARLADRGPDPRAQQPGRRRGPRDLEPARAGRGDAAEAQDDRRRQVRQGQASSRSSNCSSARPSRSPRRRSSTRWRPPTGRTRSPTGSRTTAATKAGSSPRSSSRPACTPTGSTRCSTRWART